MHGFVAPTDHGWYQFLRARPEISEVNFWKPSGRRFAAIRAGEPFFFKLKAPYNAIGGFGLFARFAALPVWHAWDVFGQANGTRDEHELLERLRRLAGGPRLTLGLSHVIGCIAVTEPVFFEPDEWVATPSDWSRNIVSGRTSDLSVGEGRRMWMDCLERAAARRGTEASWARETLDAQRVGTPIVITPRLGQASFRLAVLDAYDHQCAVTTEHSLPVLEAAHIRPWAEGGAHVVSNGIPLRRDLHRLFDLGYVTIRPDMRFTVSRRLRDEFANGRAYYELDRRQIRLPRPQTSGPTPSCWPGIRRRSSRSADGLVALMPTSTVHGRVDREHHRERRALACGRQRSARRWRSSSRRSLPEHCAGSDRP
jgi:putative restriction endonuclease